MAVVLSSGLGMLLTCRCGCGCGCCWRVPSGQGDVYSPVTVQGADAAAAGIGPEAAKGDAVGMADCVAGGEGNTEGSNEAGGVA